MVGIVVVSHNRNLAQEIINFSKTMQFHDFKIVNGGGIDTDGIEYGTNPMIISEAITEANDGDGVLVLVDLGSAIMNCEMAFEMLDGVVNIILADAPLVEGCIVAVASNNKNTNLIELASKTNETKNIDKIISL